MNFDVLNNTSDHINITKSPANLHKFLQVELLADENVAVRHKNDTADFLLVLANIVSCQCGTFTFIIIAELSHWKQFRPQSFYKIFSVRLLL